jgi:hypothetical protein
MSNLITGLFDSETAAEKAVAELKLVGYTQNEISIIMKDSASAAEFADEVGASRTMEGIGTGAAIGGTVGAVLGGLLAVGTITLPGIGFLVAGPLAAMLAGAGAGGLAGSLLGWLTSAGIPEDVAPYYERGLGEGGIVVAVASHPGDEGRVQQILRGESVAYTGYNAGTAEGYVSNTYATRYDDIQRPARLYDTTTMNTTTPSQNAASQNYDGINNVAYNTATTTTGEAERTANSAAAEARSAQRTAEVQERAAHREAHDQNWVDDASTAAQNTWDNTKTAVTNQADKVSTGAANTADRLA